jgi:16S rRNA (guanine(966)-N(2))-methyltransferase RsmD
MRIISGQLGGRRFQPPANIPARPTTDMAREGLFNILNNYIDIEGITALDLFAGTGSVSFELASRGAALVTLIEQDATSIAFIKKSATTFGIEQQLNVIRGDVFKFIRQTQAQFDFIFADPPYHLDALKMIPDYIFEENLLSQEGILVVEHDYRNNFEQNTAFIRVKKYGDTLFSFFQQS